LSGISLALASLGFSAWEARQQAADAASNSQPKPALHTIWLLLLAMLLLGAGFQVHVFINAAPLYKAVADAALLPWLLPVFWIGFSLAIYPGALWLERLGAKQVFTLASLLGVLASAFCLTSPSLVWLIGAQFVAGIAWAGVILAGLALAGGAGRHGREGLFVGALFAMLALAAVARIGLTLAGFSIGPQPELAVGLWTLGATIYLFWLRGEPMRLSR
jgi:MFS family permease